jgi:hypothetical protein
MTREKRLNPLKGMILTISTGTVSRNDKMLRDKRGKRGKSWGSGAFFCVA